MAETVNTLDPITMPKLLPQYLATTVVQAQSLLLAGSKIITRLPDQTPVEEEYLLRHRDSKESQRSNPPKVFSILANFPPD